MAWDDAKREKAVELYLSKKPTVENTVEMCAEVADEIEESVNGVRSILSKAGVYVKKGATTSGKGGSSSTETTKRVSKEDQINSLRAAIVDVGGEVDETVVSKLTGKAAEYFAKLIGKTED